MLFGAAFLAAASSTAHAQDVTVPNGGTVTYSSSQSLTTSGALLVGKGTGVTGTVVINNGGVVTMNTTDASTASRIELGNGNGAAGTLDIHAGGALIVNIANSTLAESGGVATSIGRIWVGGGPGNTTGGTGTLAMDGGTLSYVPVVAGTMNYGGLAIGRGANVTGTLTQSGDSQVVFQSIGAIDLGTQGGHGTYSLSGNAVLDASYGGVTMYVGSRTSTWAGAGTGGGTPGSGELDISGNAQFKMTTGVNFGGQLYVGDGGATGVINQSGNSTVTLNLSNPIAFGVNINSDTAGAGSGTYNLQGGTLNVGNVGGSGQIVFGDSGTGIFNVSGGTANIDTRLVLANQSGSHGTVDQTGGTVNLNGGLRFGSGTGSYTLDGGTLIVGGTISGTGTFNFGAATLRVGSTPLSSSSAATLTGPFTFDTNGSSATWSGVLSGTGSLTKAGVGTLTLSGANSYSGGTEIAGGTLALTGAGTIGGNMAAVKVDANTVFDISGSTAAGQIVIGSLSGSGTIRTGTKTLAVGNDNASTTFSGTIVNNGVGWTGAFGAFAKVGTGTLTLNNATITGGESYVLGGGVAITGTTSINYLAVGEGTGNTASLTIGNGASLTLGTGLMIGDFGGTGIVTQTGGLVTVKPLCGDGSHCTSLNIGNQGGTGTYTISGGELLVDLATATIGRSTGSSASTGTLRIDGGLVSVVNGGSIVIGSRQAAVSPGSGTITQTGGTLRFDGASNFYLSGAGSGTYNLNGGALEIGGSSLNGAFNAGAGGYHFNLGGGTIKVIGAALTTSVNATLMSSTVSHIDTNGFNAAWSGVLSGAGGLEKDGIGTLTLSGANSYSGGTEIVAGTLALTGAGTLGGNTSALKVDANTVLDISGSTATGQLVVGGLSGSGTIKTGIKALAVGNDNASTTFSGTIINNGVGWTGSFGAFAKVGTGTLTLDNATITGGESYILGGSVAITGTTAINYIAVGEGTGNTTSLSIGTGASLTLGTGMQIGDFGGTGFVTQTGGLVTLKPLCGDLTHCALLNIGNKGGTGTYTISGGELLVDQGLVTLGRNVGSGAQSAGTLQIDGGLVDITNGGSIVLGSREIAVNPGTGTINQTGGTLRFEGASSLYLSGTGNGTYNLNGGMLQIGGNSLNPVYNFGTAGYQFNLGGGTIQVIGSSLATNVNATLTASTLSHLDTNGFNASWSGVLSGAGALEKDGVGTLTLTGANTYTGGTTISAGTLQVGTGGTAGSLTGAVTNNGVLAFNRSDPITFAGAISGSGSVEQDGAGTLTFTGNSSYTGGTTIGSGKRLQIGNGATSGSIAGNVANNGTLAFNRSDTATFGGAISGGGSVEQNGGGTLIFGGANSYTGGTTISSGTLQLGTGGSLYAAGALAVNGGTFDLNGHSQTVGKLSGTGGLITLGSGRLTAGDSSNTTVASAISGSGSFVKQGIGTMTLTGASSYTGGTTVSGGTLQLGNGGTSGSLAGNVANGGVLAFNRSDAVTFAGAISGSGSVRQQGSGALTLSGASTYSGGTVLNSGTTLSLLGNTAAGTGAITLNDNATLAFADGLVVANALVVSGNNVHFSVATGQTATESGALSGSGSYQITGGGTLNLTGNNSAFTGAMILGTGTINVDTSTALGSGNIKVQGAVALNYNADGSQIANSIGITSGSTLTANVSSVGTVTQSGAITGDGGLVKAGTGVMVLTGNNTYVGGTTISAGTVQIGDGGTSGGITGNVTNNGALAVNRSDTAVLSGDISGTGSVVQNGSGSLLLSGNNNYTGDTVLNSGAVIVGSNAALGATSSTLMMAEGTALSFAGDFTVANNISVSGDPTLNVDAGQTDTVSGVISDGATPGDIVKTGDGTLILTAANTYTGGTTISGGTLALTGNGNIVGSLVDNGTFDISAKTVDASLTTLSGSGRVVLGSRNLGLTAAAGTFAGVISGTGGVTVSGGQQVFTGNNSYTGATTIASGATLQLGNGGASGSIAGNVANSGTLIFNRSDTSTYAGVMSGAGQIFQRGSGLIALSGDSSTFAGTTTIQGGTLAVDGLLGGSLVVAAGGTLAGTGTVASITMSGGTLAPGRNGAVGTLTVTSNLVLTSSSTYMVDTNSAGNSDLVAVTGSATLNGASVRIGVIGDLRLSSRYTILTATGGVNGTLTVSSSLAFLTASLSYDANDVYLTVNRNGTSFTTVATTRNQFGVAQAVESVGGGPLYNAVLQLDASAAQSAFKQLAGDVHPSGQAVLMVSSHFVRSASVDRLRSTGGAVGTSGAQTVAYAEGGGLDSGACNDACDVALGGAEAPLTAGRFAVWTQAFGTWGQSNSDGNAAGLSYSTSGFLIGADTAVSDNWRVGLLSGYSRTGLNPGSRSSSGTSDNYDVGLYGGAQWNRIGLRLGATYTWSNISTSRSVAFTGFSDSLSANYQAGTTQVFGELGYRLDAGNTAFGTLVFEPFANLAFVNVRTNGFSEQGGAAALTSSAAADNLFFQTLGLRGSTTFRVGDAALTAASSIGWRHAFGDLTPKSTVAFAGSSSFVAAGTPTAHDTAVVEAGFSTAASKSLILSIFYTGGFSDQATDQGFRGNVTWKF